MQIPAPPGPGWRVEEVFRQGAGEEGRKFQGDCWGSAG